MTRRVTRRPAPTAADAHRAWLELVDADGPFLAVPALRRAWPQGMPRLRAEAVAALRDARPAFEKAWEAWDRARYERPPSAAAEADAALEPYRAARDEFVETVLRDVLGWAESYVGDLSVVPEAVRAGVWSPNRQVQVKPAGALTHGPARDQVAALVLVVDPVDSLRAVLGDAWAASPIDRMEELLRATGVSVGVVTDGRWWAVVSAQPKVMAASGIVDALTWSEEEATRNAFAEMLSRRSLFGGRAEDLLPKLFKESVAAAEDVTEALGVQVRRAVELLVQAFSDAAVEARRTGAPDPLPADRPQVYDAAVTVMMRVVFLLFAEERDLLPQGRLFSLGYTMGGRLDELDARARHEGSETLDGTAETWHRLLAVTQALYAGATFEDLRLPSYGGSLFDPDRFAFLVQRSLVARDEQGRLAMSVSDRVLLEVLRSVQVAELRGEPARRISFRDIDVEQIGYIYEGLLGYTCADVDEVTVGLLGRAGSEPEIALAELERLRVVDPEPPALAAAIRREVKVTQPAAELPSASALAKAVAAGGAPGGIEDAERALLAVTKDAELRDRLRPFLGVIRRDLRGRPLVVQPGGLVVVETPSRATAGAHYTPKDLAEQVVLHALEPLVNSPGPRDTADRSQWVELSSDRILDIKVADIACGSGAFLVAAGRYLAGKLAEAWRREGVAGDPVADYRRAVREVVAHCLYGADINPMAVEMCKLSLWLVSLDPQLPFSFVDDKVLHGNSLLGVTRPDQLRALHIDPPEASAERLFDLAGDGSMVRHVDVDRVLREAANRRRALATEVGDGPQRSLATKRRQLRELGDLTAELNEIGDAVVATGLRLGGKPGRKLTEAYDGLRIALAAAYPAPAVVEEVAQQPSRNHLEQILAEGLTPTVPTDYDRWKPLHWPVAVADVMEQGGFDAVVGNPPFLGGTKITGVAGTNMRDWLVNVLAEGARGKADMVAYFFIRGYELLHSTGTLGLIATNTVGQGDTREVGLDRMVADGLTITRAIQSRSWPVASANLEYAAVWGSKSMVRPEVEFVADDLAVRRISTLLEPAGRMQSTPIRLDENVGVTFEGCKPYGAGFVLDPLEAADWIDVDQRNAEVLARYLGGEDLNSSADCTASRWVIDFNNMTEEAAAAYGLPFQRVLDRVRPERQRANRKAIRERWWQYADKRPALRKAIASLDEVLAVTLHSKAVMPMRVPTGQVFSHALGVFATDSFVDQAVLSSSLHQLWAITYGSTLETRVRYTATAVFETFPLSKSTEGLETIGRTLDEERREIMLRRQLGLTKLYNLVNDPEVSDASDPDVKRLREIHVELDRAVCAAYGWDDLVDAGDLDHGFHTYRQMRRWTVSPAARVELLDRLLEENHRRAAAQPPKPKGKRPAWLAGEDDVDDDG